MDTEGEIINFIYTLSNYKKTLFDNKKWRPNTETSVQNSENIKN